jgi:hypothetical protein
MQMKGTGEVASLEEGREIIRRSTELDEYTPQDPERWSALSDRFAELTGQ